MDASDLCRHAGRAYCPVWWSPSSCLPPLEMQWIRHCFVFWNICIHSYNNNRRSNCNKRLNKFTKSAMQYLDIYYEARLINMLIITRITWLINCTLLNWCLNCIFYKGTWIRCIFSYNSSLIAKHMITLIEIEFKRTLESNLAF